MTTNRFTARRSTTRRSRVHRVAGSAVTVTAALVLAACGGAGGTSGQGGGSGAESDASPSASAPQETQRHNAADIAFAQGMIPHHRQAVTMSGLAETRAASGEVRELAEKIEKAQAPEIRTMSRWLRAWGEKIPSGDAHGGQDGASGPDGHGGHGSGEPMPGMLSAEDMAELKQSTGKDFDEAYLRLMIEHHEGAVAMAGTELKEGSYQPALDLADTIIEAQTAEIAAMRKMLGGH